MRRASTLVVLAALGTALFAAGCGGDDDDDGGEALTKQEFVTQADQICKQGDAAINKEAAEVFNQGQPSQDDQVAFVTDTVVPETQAQIDGIRELNPPEGDEEQVAEILDSADNGIEEIRSDPGAALQEGDNPLAEASGLAREYGLKVCGQG